MALVPPRPKPQTAEIIAFDPVAWRERFEERAGQFQHDGGASYAEASQLAGQEAILDWMKANRANASSRIRCVHCGHALDHDRVQVTAASGIAFVHPGCLVTFVAAWRGAAIKAMIAAGFPRQAIVAKRFPRHPVDEHLEKNLRRLKDQMREALRRRWNDGDGAA